MAYDYDPEDKFGYKDTLPENHPEKVITGVEFDEEFKKIEQAVQGLQETIDGKLDVVTASLVMGGTYSLEGGVVVRSLKEELVEGQPLPSPADCPDTFLICIDDGPFMGEDLVRSDWIVSSGPENAWIPLAYSRQGASTGEPGSDGKNGKGWTAGNYNPSNGVITFLSNDGLGFTTDDVRGSDGDHGDNGENGPGWTGGSYSDQTGVITFTSDDGLGFATSDVRGKNGTNGTHGTHGDGWTSGSYDDTTGIITFTSDDGLGFATGDVRGKDGTNGIGTGTVNSVNGNFPDPDGAVSINALDVGAISQEVDPTVPPHVKGISPADITRWNNAGGSDFSGNYNDLTNKPTIPTATSQLTNNSGYITTANLSSYATQSWVSSNYQPKGSYLTQSNLNGYATQTWVSQNYAPTSYAYSKAQSDAKYELKGAGGGGDPFPWTGTSAVFNATGNGSGIWLKASNSRGPELSFTHTSDSPSSKSLRCTSGNLEVVNSGYSAVVWSVDNSGNMTATGDITAYSDEKLKDNIKVVDTGMLDMVRGVEFNWKRNGEKSSGVIAQDVQRAFPHLVRESNSSDLDSPEKSLTVNYAGLTAYLIEEIKECRKRISQLEAQLA